jgi:hypothetical protein
VLKRSCQMTVFRDSCRYVAAIPAGVLLATILLAAVPVGISAAAAPDAIRVAAPASIGPVSGGGKADALRFVQAQSSDVTGQQLPSVKVGPAPPAKAPTPVPGQSSAGQSSDGAANTLGRPSGSFQLRVDPNTGQPLTAEELRAQSDGRSAPGGSGPTPLMREPAAAGSPPHAGATGGAAAGDPGRIRVESLQAIDPDSIGVLSEKDGGFGLQMWSGSSRRFVSRLLRALPVATESPQMHDLMRRLLLSTAIAPAGQGGGSIFALRVQQLAAAGHHAEALALLEQAGARESGGALAAVRLDALLLLGNVREACALVRNQIAEADMALWQKATAFCLAVEGKTAQVELYEQLLYENGIEDPAYFTMLAGLAGRGGGKVDTLPNATPLHLAMLRAGQWSIPSDALLNPTPSALRAMATATSVPPELRLLAAERATAVGLLDAGTLRRTYAAASVPDATADEAVELAQGLDGPLATAMLFKTALSLPGEEARARMLMAMLRMARERGRYMAVARAAGTLVASIAPSKELAWFAGEAGRALLVAGDAAKARQWLMAMIEPARQREADAAQAILTLTPLVYLGDTEARIPIVDDALVGWWRGEVANQHPDRVSRAGLFFYLIEAFDRSVPGELWEAVLTDSGVERVLPVPAVRVALERASGEGRIGEMVSLGLVALGRGGPQAADAEVMARVARALRTAGLEAEARSLALEALVLNGF